MLLEKLASDGQSSPRASAHSFLGPVHHISSFDIVAVLVHCVRSIELSTSFCDGTCASPPVVVPYLTIV